MYSSPHVGRRNRSLEQPDEPHGKTLRARASRGHVSPWLLPSRRARAARRAWGRMRWFLLGLAAYAGAELLLAPRPLVSDPRPLLLPVAGAIALIRALVPPRRVWAGVALPGLLFLAAASWQLLRMEGAPQDAWAIGNIAAGAGALWLACDALRIDAVRRAPAAAGSTLERRERIQPLRTPAGPRFVTGAGLALAAVLLFASVVAHIA